MVVLETKPHPVDSRCPVLKAEASQVMKKWVILGA